MERGQDERCSDARILRRYGIVPNGPAERETLGWLVLEEEDPRWHGWVTDSLTFLMLLGICWGTGEWGWAWICIAFVAHRLRDRRRAKALDAIVRRMGSPPPG